MTERTGPQAASRPGAGSRASGDASTGAVSRSSSPSAAASHAERKPLYREDNVPIEIVPAPRSETGSTEATPSDTVTFHGPRFSGNNPSSTDRTNSSDTRG